MNNELIPDRETWIDFIRAIAIFSVVWLHASAPWLHKYGKISASNWEIGNIFDSAVRASVPLFFMISGYLLLNKPLVLPSYLKNRIVRILIPWLAWSIIYILYAYLYKGNHFSILDALLAFANGDIYYHLWFMYVLIGLYLFIPIIFWFIESDREKRSLYFLVLWFIAASLIPFLDGITSNLTNHAVNLAFDLRMFGGYSGYLIAGTLLGKMKIVKSKLWLFLGAYTLGTILTIIATSIEASQSGKFVGYYYGYIAPNVVFTSMAAFVLLKGVAMWFCQNQTLSLVIYRIGHASLGIYLIHPIFIDVIYDGRLGSYLATFSKNSVLSVPLVAIVAFSLSYLAIEIIMQIPVVRRIV